MGRNGRAKAPQDAALLDTRLERPIPLREIQELLEGPQIARWMLHVKLPKGWEGFGFSLVNNAQRWVVAAAPPLGRALQGEDHFPPLLGRAVHLDEAVDPLLPGAGGPGEPTPDDAQYRMEGEIIKGIFRKKSPNNWGGESLMFEMGDGAKFWCHAVPVGPDRADLYWDYIPPPERTIILP